MTCVDGADGGGVGDNGIGGGFDHTSPAPM